MPGPITWVTVRQWHEEASQWGIAGYSCDGEGVSATAREHGVEISYESGADAGYTLHFPWHVVLSYKTRNIDSSDSIH